MTSHLLRVGLGLLTAPLPYYPQWWTPIGRKIKIKIPFHFEWEDDCSSFCLVPSLMPWDYGFHVVRPLTVSPWVDWFVAEGLGGAVLLQYVFPSVGRLSESVFVKDFLGFVSLALLKDSFYLDYLERRLPWRTLS